MADQEPTTAAATARARIRANRRFRSSLSTSRICRSRIRAPRRFSQWQVQPSLDVQFNIAVNSAARRRPRSHAQDRSLGAVGQRRPFRRRPELCRAVRPAQPPRRSAPAVPSDRSAAAALPVRSPDHRRGGVEHAASRRCCSIRSTLPPPTWGSCRRSRAGAGRERGAEARRQTGTSPATPDAPLHAG